MLNTLYHFLLCVVVMLTVFVAIYIHKEPRQQIAIATALIVWVMVGRSLWEALNAQ